MSGTTARHLANWIAGVAVLVSVAALALATWQSVRANEISANALNLAQQLSPKLNLYVNNIDATPATEPEPGIFLDIEMVNTGDMIVSGCNTE
ncbi:hypothetical protein [Microbacterium testaceum]|uniref:hypothetical protein n=1 Tax=Microbacterium testaceum TaxID=2033 RepID=UPI00128F829F|nr:hypothetical protein [Microbacterium testaceum]